VTLLPPLEQISRPAPGSAFRTPNDPTAARVGSRPVVLITKKKSAPLSSAPIGSRQLLQPNHRAGRRSPVYEASPDHDICPPSSVLGRSSEEHHLGVGLVDHASVDDDNPRCTPAWAPAIAVPAEALPTVKTSTPEPAWSLVRHVSPSGNSSGPPPAKGSRSANYLCRWCSRGADQPLAQSPALESQPYLRQFAKMLGISLCAKEQIVSKPPTVGDQPKPGGGGPLRRGDATIRPSSPSREYDHSLRRDGTYPPVRLQGSQPARVVPSADSRPDRARFAFLVPPRGGYACRCGRPTFTGRIKRVSVIILRRAGSPARPSVPAAEAIRRGAISTTWVCRPTGGRALWRALQAQAFPSARITHKRRRQIQVNETRPKDAARGWGVGVEADKWGNPTEAIGEPCFFLSILQKKGRWLGLGAEWGGKRLEDSLVLFDPNKSRHSPLYSITVYNPFFDVVREVCVLDNWQFFRQNRVPGPGVGPRNAYEPSSARTQGGPS